MSLNPSFKATVSAGPTAGSSRLGFQVHVQFATSVDAGDLHTLGLRLDGYLLAQGLERSGTWHRLTVWSEDRCLTLDDQVEMLLWLICQCGPRVVEIGPLQPQSRRSSDGPLPTLRAVSTDLDLLPITWLYGRGRVSAAQVAEMLGGFCLSATVH